jgi:DNA-binding NarL/FixJ family response regulator
VTDNWHPLPSVSVSLLVVPGLSNAEVAETLHVSVPTAETDVSRIPTKLAAR